MSGNFIIRRLLSDCKLYLHNKKFLNYKSRPWVYRKLHKISSGNLSPRNVYLVDENEDKHENKIANATSKFTERSYTCDDLRSHHIGQTVTLCGWLEYQRMNKFVVLRDGYGQTQLLIDINDRISQKLLESLPFESILKVTGTVVSRPADMINPKQATGEVEVLVDKLTVLNLANSVLPFNIREFQKAKEHLRMQYRYLDLRFQQMQHNLRLRSKVLMKMREYLINEACFIEVETPTLFKATPGGAQEFIVPTRFPGHFYSLVQSPQQFKQMLMAGAIDRYFQIARCYRDEGSRSDRQPEFTQLDIELSFTNVDGVMKLIEELLQHSWPEFLNPLPLLFKRISYDDALELYGSDKPDTRMEYMLQNCTEMFKVFEKHSHNFGAYFIVVPEFCDLSKKIQNDFKELAKQYAQVKFLQSKVTNTLDWIQKIRQLIPEDVATNFVNQFNIPNNCILFLAFGNKKHAQSLLGKIRIEYVNYLEQKGFEIRKKDMHMIWVVNFPLFEIDKETKQLNSAHHPFTAPHPDDTHLLESNPLEVRALAYDLVLNGNEIGGGSIRIHDAKQQEQIFKLLNIDKSSMQHMIDMLGSGCPPHGGIALGLDRFLAVLLNTVSIRDVIAFPKTFDGRDPISGAPSPVTERDKKLYHIATLEN